MVRKSSVLRECHSERSEESAFPPNSKKQIPGLRASRSARNDSSSRRTELSLWLDFEGGLRVGWDSRHEEANCKLQISNCRLGRRRADAERIGNPLSEVWYRYMELGLLLCFILLVMAALAGYAGELPPGPHWIADVGQASVKVYRVQIEPFTDTSGVYDWGACVMKDGDLYRMWWVRQSPPSNKTLPYETTGDDGKPVTVRYNSECGDRVYYAESKDGYTWHLSGKGDEVAINKYGPDSPTPIMVLKPSDSRWEKAHLGDPSVVKVGDTFYMYYETCSAFRLRKNEKGEVSAGTEFHNQVFLATSKDGRHWKKWPKDDDPQPIVKAPESNLQPGKQSYGFGQPTACYKNGRFILHYVDSCTWFPDVLVRLESSDPTFRDARPTIEGLVNRIASDKPVPAGAVSKYAQTDICWLGDSFYLVRPVYGTDRIAILRSKSGVFYSDDISNDPLSARRQIALHDPRGVEFRNRLYPRFLRTPHGEVVGDETHFSVFYGSGDGGGPGWGPRTWDIYRADIAFIRPLEEDHKRQ